MIDVLFVNPSNAINIYQGLSNKISAIEPPTWSLLLSESCRSKGFKVDILDCLAENLDDDEALSRIKEKKARLICFVVYGQNVNAGTTSMSGATRLANFLKEKKIDIPIAFIGSHVQALPKQTMKNEKSIDMVFQNEGVYSLWNLLNLEEIIIKELYQINGIAFRDKDKIIFNKPEKVVPQERMDVDLPGYAWDLLPYKEKPFDLYRSPMWHAEYKSDKRTPYAALQTSLGCQFTCDFCMINLINKSDNDEIGIATKHNKMRFWSTDFIIKEFDKLIKYGVKTIRIIDEMFLLNRKYYLPLCKLLSERNKNDDLNMWAYSRIDTVRDKETLKIIRKAGIKFLALGIENANKNIRLEISKGKFENVDIEEIVEHIHQNDIDVMANYIYGLPGDTRETIEETFKLSVKLNTVGWNTYPAMALPGTQLYQMAIKNNIKLPKDYESFSFHSYNTQPLPTEKLTAGEILKLRDEKFIEYHSNPKFLKKIKEKYGEAAYQNVMEINKVKLKRALY